MISGSGLLLSSENRFKLSQYYQKRWRKIYPIFYLCWIVLYFLLVIKHHSFFFRGAPWKFVFTLLGMDGYLDCVVQTYYIIGEWFLGALIIIYLIFPLLRKIFHSRARGLFTIILVALCILNNLYPFPYIPGREWIGYDILIFWLGMCMVDLEELVCKTWWPFLFNVIIILILFFVPLPVKFNCDILVGVLSLNLYSLIMIIAQKVIRSDVHAVVHWINKRSYPIYLVHHVVIIWFVEYFGSKITKENELVILAFLIVLIIACASVLYRVNRRIGVTGTIKLNLDNS